MQTDKVPFEVYHLEHFGRITINRKDNHEYIGEAPNRDMAELIVSAVNAWAKLPRTKDGITMYPDMEVWALFRDGIYRGEIQRLTGEKYKRLNVIFDEPISLYDEDPGTKIITPLKSCLYSTREAAEAARDASIKRVTCDDMQDESRYEGMSNDEAVLLRLADMDQANREAARKKQIGGPACPECGFEGGHFPSCKAARDAGGKND